LRSRVAEALSWLGLPDEVFADRQWSELSGGEAQRVALAARLVLKPEVLLLDEPTASVDAVSVERIKAAALKARNEWGTTLLIASHDWQWLYEVCDEVLQLFNGQLVGPGRMNIVLGPWQARTDGYWQKVLSSGQEIVTTAPPVAAAVAVVDSDKIMIVDAFGSKRKRKNILKGTISRLVLEIGSRKIVATVLVDGMSFAVMVPPQRIESLNLYPGREIDIYFSPNSVKWIHLGDKNTS
jgi:tungstate transport system ATP-binding protein